MNSHVTECRCVGMYSECEKTHSGCEKFIHGLPVQTSIFTWEFAVYSGTALYSILKLSSHSLIARYRHIHAYWFGKSCHFEHLDSFQSWFVHSNVKMSKRQFFSWWATSFICSLSIRYTRLFHYRARKFRKKNGILFYAATVPSKSC